MRSLYVEGNSILHRIPAGPKLGGLALVSLLLFLSDSLIVLAGAVAVATAAHRSLRLETAELWARLRPFALMILIVAVFTAAFDGLEPGLVVLLRLTALSLFASLVTATTRLIDFIDVIERSTRPLERIGLLRSQDIGLAVGLVIRFVPEILDRYHAIRDAHHARGLKPRPVSLMVPLIIGTLRTADEIASAIDARSIRRQK